MCYIPDNTRGNGEFEESVRRAFAWMRERREGERDIVRLAAQDPDLVAKELVAFARLERARLGSELRERFGFSVETGSGANAGKAVFVCRFEEPKRRPKVQEQVALWTDLLVHTIAFERALAAMDAAMTRVPEPDRGSVLAALEEMRRTGDPASRFPALDTARAVCNAFTDVMREAPVVYVAFASDTSTPSGRLIFQMLASFAEYERETIRERTRAGLHRAYRGGKHFGAAPYGYRTDEGGLLQVVPEEAEIVRGIIENVAEGSTLYAEAKRLNDLGVPTPGWRYGNGKKRPGAALWSVMTISNIVRRPPTPESTR